MSESIEILISADDQASKKMVDASINIEQSSKRVESILGSLKSPAEKYGEQLEELSRLQNEGAISADQFAAAQEKINQKIQGGGNAFKEVGGKAKSATEFVGVLASLTGNSEIAGFAGQIAGMTDKVGQFSEVSKEGGAGAFAFKLGLVSLVGTIAVGVGKAIGDAIFQTKKFERAMEAAKEKSKELNDAMASMRQQEFSNRKEDIELIRDPEDKQAAQKQLLDELNRDISAVTANVNKSQREVEEWADAWPLITGERKAASAMATEELANDKARLAALKAQRDEMIQITSVRAAENEAIRQANEAKDKSESYLENLRLEVEYLRATKEEQIELDAARNTTIEDRGEAQRLLEERDAILAKAEAEKELERTQQQARDAETRAAEQAKQRAKQQIQKIEDLKKSEMERLELQRIEIEQGKEAAKVKELMNQGLDEESARKIAAEEAAIEKLKETQTKQLSTNSSGGGDSKLQAFESRLLTRGPGDRRKDPSALLEELISETKAVKEATEATASEVAEIKNNQLANPQLQVVGVP
jgi:hypothetical protein